MVGYEYKSMKGGNKAAIIIPVHNRMKYTLSCLRQLRNVDNCGHVLDIVVVDDGSTDGTADAIRREFSDVVVLRGDGNLWWTGAINKGIKYALGRGYNGVLFLNDDLELDKRFLCELFKVVIDNPDALVSSLKLRKTADGITEIITAGFDVVGVLKRISNRRQGEIYDDGSISEVESCDILTGAALYVPISVVSDIGLLDFKKFPHNWGDLEFTRRASLRGYKCLVATKSHIFTQYNPNYHRTYFIESSRTDYLKHLFDRHKYSYGFVFTVRAEMMHKPLILGLASCALGIGRNIKYLLMKMFLPRSILRRYCN